MDYTDLKQNRIRKNGHNFLTLYSTELSLKFDFSAWTKHVVFFCQSVCCCCCCYCYFFHQFNRNFFFRSIAKLETLSNAGQHDAFSFLWRSYHSSWSRSQCMNWSRWWKFSEISKWPYLSRYLLALHSKKLKTLLYLVEGLDTPVIKSSKLLHG